MEKRYWIFLLTALLAMLLYNLLECPFLSDDLLYYFVFERDEDGHWINDSFKRVETLSQLWWSQWEHYSIMNGRWVAHTMVQFKLAFVPPVVFKVANAVMFVLLLHVSTLLTAGSRKTRLLAATVVCFLLFVVIRSFRTTFLWDVGSFNYLWILTANIAFFVYLLRIKDEPVSAKHWLLAVFSVFVGWNHEALALPVLTALAAFLLFNWRSFVRTAPFPYVVFYVLGSIICLLTPSMTERVAESQTFAERLFFGAVNYVFSVRVLWLLVAFMAYLWFADRSHLKQEVIRLRYAFVALSVAFSIVFFVGTTSERAAFMADFLAVLVLTNMVAVFATRRPSFGKAVTAFCCAVLLLLIVPVAWVKYEHRQDFLFLEQQLKNPENKLVAIRSPQKHQNVVLDFLRDRYVNFDMGFGYYGPCFHKERLIAAVYGRPVMDFLPEDVLLRMEADEHAFDRCGTDANGELFIRRIAPGTQVSSITVMSASSNETFELDDSHFKTLQVGAGSYLIFTRPPGRKYREISKISYCILQP